MNSKTNGTGMERACLSLAALYAATGGGHLEDGRIETEIRDEKDGSKAVYYDLYFHGQLACMDGEECAVVRREGGRVELLNTEGEEPVGFTLTEDEFGAASFRARRAA